VRRFWFNSESPCDILRAMPCLCMLFLTSCCHYVFFVSSVGIVAKECFTEKLSSVELELLKSSVLASLFLHKFFVS
jgi:hypothetical protein